MYQLSSLVLFYYSLLTRTFQYDQQKKGNLYRMALVPKICRSPLYLALDTILSFAKGPVNWVALGGSGRQLLVQLLDHFIFTKSICILQLMSINRELLNP